MLRFFVDTTVLNLNLRNKQDDIWFSWIKLNLFILYIMVGINTKLNFKFV